MDLRQFETMVRGVIGSHFTTDQLCFENQQFEPPANSPWVRLVISPSSSRQISLGKPSVTRQSGFLYIHIYVPIGEGSERSDWIYDTIADVFSKQIIDGVRFQTAYPSPGRDGGQGWYSRHCTVPYYFDQEA